MVIAGSSGVVITRGSGVVVTAGSGVVVTGSGGVVFSGGSGVVVGGGDRFLQEFFLERLYVFFSVLWRCRKRMVLAVTTGTVHKPQY